MKRLALICTVLLTSIFSINLYARQEATLIACESWGEPCSTSNPVYIDMNNPMGVAGVQFVLKFDGTLLTADNITSTPRTSSMNLGYSIGEDSIKVILYSIMGDSILPGEGPIVEILFDVDGGAVLGDSTLLHIKDCVLSDPSAQPIPCIIEDGWFYFLVIPIPPTILSPTDGSFLSDSMPTFVWGSVNGASRYWLQLDDNSLFSSPLINDSILTDSFYTPTTGLPDTGYYWHVCSGNRFEWSSWSSVWSFEIDTDIPDVPTLILPLNESWFDDSTIIFEWNAVLKGEVSSKKYGVSSNLNPKVSEIRYIIQIDTTDSFGSPVFVDTTETTADTVNLSEDYYYWRVKAFDLAGNVGGFSTVWEFGIDITPPISFNLISPEDSASLAIIRPTFIWQTSNDSGSGLKDYEVYIDGALEHTGVDTFWTADYDLSEDYHSWYVIAYDSVDNSRQSNQTWTVLIDTTAPSLVSLLSPPNNSYLGESTVNFIWNSANDNLSGVDHYLLQYANDFVFTTPVDTEITDTICTIVLQDTIYYWRVRAVDKATNQSNWSEVWSFEIDTQEPASPDPISPDSAYLNFTQVVFQWTEVTKDWGKGVKAAPVHYVLEVDTAESFTTPYVDTTDITTDTLTLPELRYYWHVKAYDEAGNESQFSETLTFIVDTTMPEVVTLASPDSGLVTNNSIVTFIWYQSTDNLSGIEHYILQYADNPDFISAIDTGVTDTSFTTMLSNTIYYWRIKAIDKATNESDWSDIWSFEIDTDIPDTPELLSPEDSSYLSNIVVTFEWSEVMKGINTERGRNGERENIGNLSGQNPKSGGSKASPIHYILQVDTILNFNTPVVDTTDLPVDTLTLNEYLYYWRVGAYDEAGNEGVFSETSWFVVDITSPIIDSTTQLQDTVAFWGPFTIETMIIDNFSVKEAVLYFRINNSDWIQDTMAFIGNDWYMGVIPEQTPADTLTVDYYITASDSADNMSRDPEEGNYSFKIFLTGIQERRDIPDKFVLFSPIPNPSIGIIKIQYGLPKKTYISLRVYDIQGRLIKSIYKGTRDAGYYKLLLNTKDLSSGIYFIHLDTPKSDQIRQLIILQ